MTFNRLKTKYIAGISCLILFVFISLLSYGFIATSQRIEDELHRRAISIARNVAISALKPIITENRIELQLLLSDTLKNEENIRYIFLVDHHGELIAHTFGSSFPKELLAFNKLPLDAQHPLIEPVTLDGERVGNIGVVIKDGEFGRVYVGLSEASLTNDLFAIVLQGMPIVVVMFLIGIAAAWWYAIRITKPISELVKSVQQVGIGNFDAEITVTSHDEIGELSQAFNLMLDQLRQMVAEQKKTENELHLQAEMLEEEVAEHQLARENLEVQQNQLASLNLILEERIKHAVDELRLKDKVMMLQGRQAAMGEMINNIAHQWRQPINNLGLLVQGIKADHDCNLLDTQTLQDYVSRAMSTIIFMSQTINDFSSFFNADRQKTDFTVFQGIKKVVSMLEATLSSGGITILIEQQAEVAVRGFLNEYNQVLLNLISNSKDILLQHDIQQPTIKVIITREQDNAVVRVWDNGGGIPEEIMHQIFDPYFTTKKEGKGSGIGLYMSRMIITEHFNGALTVANRDGGAEFCITTPCLKVEL